MKKQKLYKNGNSIAVTIPKEYLHDLKLRDGSEVMVVKDAQNESLTIYPNKKVPKQVLLTSEFKQWLSGIEEKYSDVIEELAKK